MKDFKPALVKSVAESLLSAKSHSAVIKLCGTFCDVDWSFEAIIQTMARTKDWISAEMVVRTFEKDGDRGDVVFQTRGCIVTWVSDAFFMTALANILVSVAVELREFKKVVLFIRSETAEQLDDADFIMLQAHRFVQDYSLQEVFPDIGRRLQPSP